MQVTPIKLKNKFPKLITEIIGNENQILEGVGSAKSSSPTDIGFVFNLKNLSPYLESNCAALVIPLKALPTIPKSNKVLLLSPNPELAMAFIVQEFFAPQKLSTAFEGIHPTAIISPSARMGKHVSIGPYVVIGHNTVIGDHTQISAHCVIEDQVEIGKNCRLYPFVFVGQDCKLGDDCIIHPHVSIGSQGFGYAHDETGRHYHKPHLGAVILGNRVEVGAGTQIDRGTIDASQIGEGTKIDNLCHFGHNAIIGKNSLITANFVSAGSVKIGDNFICGGRTTVAGHLEVGDNMTIAAHSTIGKTLKQSGQYGGYPLVPLQTYMKNQATTAFLAEMRKNIHRLMKKVFPNES